MKLFKVKNTSNISTWSDAVCFFSAAVSLLASHLCHFRCYYMALLIMSHSYDTIR